MTQLYPAPLDPKTLTRQVWDSSTARRIPGVGRALDLIGGLVGQMPLDAMAGVTPLPRPRLLEEPDLDLVRPTFVRVQVEDYLLHGNAAHLVTARHRGGSRMGWPAAVKWFPAHAWHVDVDPQTAVKRYYLHGQQVPAGDVVHVQNGADPLNPARGVGVIERYVRTFDRVALQEAREREDLTGGQVPSVAVIAPQRDLTEPEADDAADVWESKFRGPGRRPAILPHGTTVTPLAWSPNDAQATEARQLALTDVANAFNLDAYWLGAPSSSHTYRSPGPLFLMLLRTSLENVLAPFEASWTLAWLPRGQLVTFARSAILGDDMKTTVETLVKATGGKPLMTVDESRAVLKLAPRGLDDLDAPAGAPPAPTDEPDDPAADDPTQPDPEEQDR